MWEFQREVKYSKVLSLYKTKQETLINFKLKKNKVLYVYICIYTYG